MNPRWDSMQTAVLLLSRLASEDGLPVEEVAGILGLEERRIPKWADRISGPDDDLADVLEDVGIVVDEDGRVCATFGPRFSGPLRLSLQELIALVLLCSQVEAGAGGTALGRRVHALRKELLELGSTVARTPAAEVQEHVRVEADAPTPALDRVEQAVAEHRVLEVTYFSEHSAALKTFEVRPCACVQTGGHWYLVTDRKWLLRVDRIRALRFTGERFEAPEDFDVDALPRDVMFIGDANVEVVIGTAGGRSTVRTASPEQLKSWVRSLAGDVWIVSPPELRESLVEECRALLARYETP